MGFFGKKKVEDISKENEESTLKTELGLEIEKLQKEINEKQVELDEITQRITTVKEEYDSTVGSLMLVKKELNQKKMELDIIQREYRETRERAKKSELIKDSKSVEKFNKTEGDHSKIKEELEEFTVLILEKLEKAQRDLKMLTDAYTNNNEHGTNDTSPTFKVLEEGYQVLSKEENSRLAARQQKFINNLENALVRIKNGTYGICIDTGKLIGKARLKAVPHTQHSIEAKLNK